MDKIVPKFSGDSAATLGYEQLEWEKKIVEMASFIVPEDKTIMDLGAGNMHLRGLLNINQQYIPVDYKSNSEDTIVCDFNKGEFPSQKVDVFFAAGILEYINEPYWFLNKMCEQSSKCILSYKGKEKHPSALLSSDDVIDYMKKQGFTLTGKVETLEEWTLIGCFERMVPEKLAKQVKCTGCGSCINACKKDALYFEYDNEGFYKPKYNKSKCTNCNQCLKVCPVINGSKSINYNNPDIYAVWAKDDIRIESSSGGVFSVLAQKVIDNGGYVFGARWDEHFNCIIDYTNDINNIDTFRHSKYVQADTGKNFRKVKELIKDNHYVLYVGTPCQIDGLYNYLGKNDDEFLITIDLVCFGVPSNQVFHKYLEERDDKVKIKDIVFRDKRAGEGWSPTGYGIYFEDGTVIHDNGKDFYQKAFHNVIFRNDTCEKCDYYKLPRKGDITLGDFWGIQQADPTWNDKKGTSIVTINSEKAQNIWEKIQDEFQRVEKVPVEWCMNKGNRIVTNARSGHKNRKYFSELLKKEQFNKAVETALSDKHEIGIVCVMNYNIGNNLTNYGLFKVISDMGYFPKLIDMPSEVLMSKYYNKDGSLFYFLKSPYKDFEIYKPYDKQELYENSERFGMFIVASDQLWRDNFVVDTDYFTVLDWVKSSKYKISYATSMGKNNFDATDSVILRTKSMLQRFNKISVRENTAQNLLQQWDIDSDIVLDPVFLCSREYYDELAERGRMRTMREPYVAGYFLDASQCKEKVLCTVADKYCNGKYMAMTGPSHSEVQNATINYTLLPGIEEWVAMIKESDYVVTDSFHGMCFSIIYEKQFIVIFEKDNWRGKERFESFLSQLGLENRLFMNIPQSEEITQISQIDYSAVNEKIRILKDESFSWLKCAIEGAKSFIGQNDYFDYCMQIENDHKKEMIEINECLKRIKSDLFIQKQLVRNVKCENNRRQSNMIVGWGAGCCFRKNELLLKKYSNMQYVCDNNPSLWGVRLTETITCISPAELLKLDNPMVLIMVENPGTAISIANNLMEMGITHYEHIYNWIKELK